MNLAPSYKCNLHCKFCFNQEFWNNEDILNLSYIENELYSNNDIYDISIIGGEPTCWPDQYLSDLLDLCTERFNGQKPSIFTNLTKPFKYVDKVDELNISYDPYDRHGQQKVIMNMMLLDVPYIVNMLLTKNLVTKMDPYQLIKFSEKIRHKIHLDVLGNIATNNMDYMIPNHEELIKFLTPIIKENNPYIKFYPIEFLKGNQRKESNIEMRFQKDVTLTADKKYMITNADIVDASYGAPMIKIKYDTYKEAKNAFFNLFKLPKKCKKCEYKNNCIGNKKIMDDLKALVNEYNSNISM